MKRYIALIDQASRGCDYTIACGKEFIIVYAENQEDAFKSIISRLYWDDNLSKDGEPPDCNPCSIYDDMSTFEMYELGDTLPNLLDDAISEAQKLWDARETKERRSADEVEFERLKKKLGK